MVDANLITNVKNKDKQAFKELFNLYRPNVYRTAYLILKDYQYADDVVQDAFLQVFLNIHKLENVIAFEMWLYKITMNSCFKVIKKNKRQIMPISDEEIASQISNTIINGLEPEKIVVQNEMKKELIKCIYNLSLKHRTVLILFYFNSFTVKEIAEIIECSEGTVKSRLFYAKKVLKNIIETEGIGAIDKGCGGVLYEK